MEEEELLNARYVDEIEEDGSSEDYALRAAVQTPFEEESLEAENAEEATHPFQDFEEELLQDTQEALEKFQAQDDEIEKVKKEMKKIL